MKTYYETGEFFHPESVDGGEDNLEIICCQELMPFQTESGIRNDFMHSEYVGVLISPGDSYKLPSVELYCMALHRSTPRSASRFYVCRSAAKMVKAVYPLPDLDSVMTALGYMKILGCTKIDKPKSKACACVSPADKQQGPCEYQWMVWPEGSTEWVHTFSKDFARHVAYTAGGSNVIEYMRVRPENVTYNEGFAHEIS